jgi:phosphomannomutase
VIGHETDYHGAVEHHVDRILALPNLDVECIGRRRLKVVVDALHGAGGPIAAKLLNALGCQVEVLYGEPTGQFPREPEPVPENLDDLRQAVIDRKADVGFALDPDGDRLAVVDETGRAVGEDATLPLAMRYALRARTGPVVVNYSTSLLVDAVAERFACPVYRAPVGEANVVAKMREVEAVIGGEGNGGVILPDLHLGRDAPVGMALIVALLSEEDRSLSALVNEMPRYVMRKQKIEGDAGLDADALDGIAARFRGAHVDRTDGLYLRWPDGFLHVRRSGTEPIVRIIAEAESPERLNERMNGVRGLLAAGH